MEYIKRGRWRYLAFVCQSCDKQFERRIDRVNATGAKAICSSCVLSEKAKQNKKHGFYGTPTYVSWVKMKDRCLNPRHKYFYLYGGRGITIDPKWMDFIGFLEDMGPMPMTGYSIDRIDNDLGYSKSNCRWIPRNEQQKNRRVCKAKPGRIPTLNRH
jgi:hypothetical protein